MALGFFNRGSDDNTPLTFSPEKAAVFFNHARTAHDTGSYEYAIQNWLNGLRQDPRQIPGLEGFLASLKGFLATPESKRGLSKETLRAISGNSIPDRFVYALMEWGFKQTDVGLALKAAELAGKSQANDVGAWICEQAYRLTVSDKKPRKDYFLKLSEAFDKLSRADRALNCLEAALRLDPSDGELAHQVRSMAAKATMSRGGYEQAGTAGAFRGMIKDLGKQQALEESERIAKTDDVLERNVKRAKEAFDARPEDLPTLNLYVKALLERSKGDDEDTARGLLMKAYERTQQIRLKIEAEEIRNRQMARRVRSLREALEAAPNDPDLPGIAETAARELFEAEIETYKLKVQAYPTDLGLKYELGRRYFGLEKFDDAIALFQEAQNDPKHRASVLNYMGQAFLRSNLEDEAIETFRAALASTAEKSVDLDRELRYWLMVALQAKGAASRDLAAAEEADRLASKIMMEQISYRDIRTRRDAIKKLVAELKAK